VKKIKKTLERATKDTLEWLDDHKGVDKEEYDSQYQALEHIVQPIFSKLYQQAGAGGAGGAGGSENMDDHDEL